MLKGILAIVLVALTTFAQSQNTDQETVLIDFLGKENYLSSMENNPGKLKFLYFKFKNGYKVVEASEEKMESFETINYLKKSNKLGGEKIYADEIADNIENGSFNILLYEFSGLDQKNQYYKIGDNDLYIVVYSNLYLTNKFKNQ